MTTSSTSGKRTRRVLEAGVSAIFSKGIVLLVNAISIPIIVRYLGAEQFGIWVTISTTLSLLIVLDLGIANALTNLISEAYAKENEALAGRYASSAFWMMLVVVVFLGLAGWLIWPHVPWGWLFHVADPTIVQAASKAVAFAYVVFLLGLPAGLAAKILGGYQELRTANIVSAIASVANLAAVLLLTRSGGGLIALVGVPAAASVLVNALCLVWIWLKHKPFLVPVLRNWSSSISRRLMSGGSEFFILQLTGLVVFNSDNFVILHYLGPADVTPYSVTWKLVGYAASLQIIITPALWPAYSEAYVRGDITWIRRTFRNVMLSTMSIAASACFVMIAWGKLIIRLWAGSAAVPNQSLIVAMCAWILISTYMANTSTVLLASSRTKLIAWLSVVAALINLAFSIWLVKRIGSIGVILGTIISYILILVGPQTSQFCDVIAPKARSPHVA